jgi:hypothetical protein
LPKPASNDRRVCARYPVSLDIHYTVQDRYKPLETGSGRIVDFSSSGLRFIADSPLTTGVTTELSVDWPSALDGRVQLQLVASGTVVWTRGTETALRLRRHEFRTRRRGLFAV